MRFLHLLGLYIAAIGCLLLLLNAPVSSQAVSANQLDELKNQLLPAEYRNKNFTVDEVKKVLREKCRKVTGVDNSTLYQEIEKSASQLTLCLSSIINITAIQAEIEVARPIGELDSVFHKYCTKAPDAHRCLTNFSDVILPCLSTAERTQNAALMRITKNLLSFLCTKGGDQIALFVAEQGPECLEANRDALAHCFNSSFAEYVPKQGNFPDLFNLPELIVEPKHCTDLTRFEACALHHIGQCNDITPVNVAESVFRFLKNETSCKKYLDDKSNEQPILRASVLRYNNTGGNGTAIRHGATALGLTLSAVVGSIYYLHW